MKHLILIILTICTTSTAFSFDAYVQSMDYWWKTGVSGKINNLKPSPTRRKSIMVNGVQLNDIAMRWSTQVPHGRNIMQCVEYNTACKTSHSLSFRKKAGENGEILRAYQDLNPNLPIVMVMFGYKFPVDATLSIMDGDEKVITQLRIPAGTDDFSLNRTLPQGTDFAIISLSVDTGQKQSFSIVSDLLIIGSQCVVDTITLTCTNSDYFEVAERECRKQSFFGDRATTLADIDGDKLDDLVAVSSDKIRFRKNLGSSCFSTEEIILSTPYYGTKATTFADINGDGFDDAVVVNDSGTTVKYNNRSKAFGPHTTILNIPYYGTRATTFADIDGDGYDDFVVVNESSAVVKYNNKMGRFGVNIAILSIPYYGTKATGFADIDGDGYDDFVVVNDSGIFVKVNNRSGSFGPTRSIYDGAYYGSISTEFGDINGDGKDDIIVFNSNEVVAKVSLNYSLGSNTQINLK